MLLFWPVSLFAGEADSIPRVLYFNENFEIRDIQSSSFYGIIERTEKKQYAATIFTPKNQKIATVAYTGREKLSRDGRAVGFHQNGETQFIATFDKNNLNGKWVSYYNSGQVCDSGNIIKNAPHGKWMCYYPDGTVRMYIEFNSKKLSQVKEEMRRFYRPVAIYPSVGSPLGYSPPPGYGMNLASVRGPQAYIRAVYRQLHETTHPSEILGKTAALALKHKVDLNTVHFKNDYSPPFEECLVHGLFKSYFPNGKLKDSGYRYNGLKTGVWQEFSADGKTLSRGFYKKGQRRGEWKYYGTDGKFLYMRRYNRHGKEKELVKLARENEK